MPEHGSIGYPESGLSLEEQFESPEKWEINGEEVEVVDVWPPITKTEVPTVLLPGWTLTPQVYRENIMALAEGGRRTISVDSPHGIETGHKEQSGQLRKAVALLGALEKKGIEKVDAVAHSEGGINLVIAATLQPERFRNIVLVDPAGLVGKDPLRRLAAEFSGDVFGAQIKRMLTHPETAPRTIRAFIEGTKTILKGPRQASKDVLGLNAAQIQDMLAALKEKGIGISIIHAVNDEAFPMDRVQKMVSSKQVHGFYSVKGTHNELYLNPKAMTGLVDQALTALEKRKK